jgi:hypothetical protein
MLDFGALDRALLADRGVGTHMAVGQRGTRADHSGSAHGATVKASARLDHHPALDLGF